MQLPSSSRGFLAAAVVVLAVAGCRPASGQAAPAEPLAAAVARASGSGWRTQTLADGNVAAVGVGSIGGTNYVIGVACGARKRPEIMIETRGAPAPRALLVETTDTVMAFPLARSGATPPAVDALVAGLFDPADKTFRFWLDAQPFPADGAREAFEQVGQDCEQRTGWQYGVDDDRQLAWIFMPRPDDAPLLTFGKPSSGLVFAQLSCTRAAGALIVKSTSLPRRAKTGQKVRLSLRVGERDYTANGVVEMFAEGDVSGFVTARFARPQALFDALRDADSLTFQARDAKLTVSAIGLGALLSRFQAACGFTR